MVSPLAILLCQALFLTLIKVALSLYFDFKIKKLT